MRKNNVVASMEGLECSKRAENIINRKVSIFYIETVLNFFFQLRKIIFLRSTEKKIKPKSEHFWNFFENEKKSTIFNENHMIFIENCWFFFIFEQFSRMPTFWFYFFFRSISEKLFFGVEKKAGVQFRCKKLRPFDLWGFRSDCDTPSWGNSQMGDN